MSVDDSLVSEIEGLFPNGLESFPNRKLTHDAKLHAKLVSDGYQ